LGYAQNVSNRGPATFCYRRAAIFVLNLDISSLIKLDEEMIPTVRRVMTEAVRDLSAQTHAHIVEQVQQRLHSTREKYIEQLGFHPVSEDTWMIELEPGAFFIEDGIPPGREMIDALLDDRPRPWAKQGKQTTVGQKRGKTKRSKDGHRYRVIPFEHSKGPTQQTPAAASLTDTIKRAYEKNAPGEKYGKLERGADGQPKKGFIRGFDIMKAPKKTSESPGQGKGPLGAVRQGPTGIPFLQGVRVYQKEVVDNRTGKKGMKKFVMTFRIVSDKHRGTGRWVHPGLQAKHFFDEAFEWALAEWETKVRDRTLAQIVDAL
jgi:hypothetical protein